MDDDEVVFFDALAALPAVDDPVAASNTDATSDVSLDPLADADDVEPASHSAGLSAAGSGAPSASGASLGLPAGRRNTPGDVDVTGMGPNDVDGDVANPVGDGASGDPPLGLSTGGDVGPQQFPGESDGSVDGIAPLAVDTSLGLLAGRSSSQGDVDVSGIDPNVVDGDYTLGLSTGGNISPPASPDGTSGPADGNDAPSMTAVDVGQAADGHGLMEDGVGGATASPGTNVTPARQSTRLYPLFNGRNMGLVRNASAGRGGQLDG